MSLGDLALLCCSLGSSPSPLLLLASLDALELSSEGATHTATFFWQDVLRTMLDCIAHCASAFHSSSARLCWPTKNKINRFDPSTRLIRFMYLFYHRGNWALDAKTRASGNSLRCFSLAWLGLVYSIFYVRLVIMERKWNGIEN
jgi:hypothetical protein